jgi:hypothetical protein
MPSKPAKARSADSTRFRELVRQAVSDKQILEICAMLSNAAINERSIIAAKLLFNYLGGPPRAGEAPATPNGGARIYLPKVYDFERVNAAEPADANPARDAGDAGQ